MDEEHEEEQTEEKPVRGKDIRPIFSTKALTKTRENKEED
ncbi:hypothetical protein BMS3Abin16_00209 [archaeon BMS3Abin16]|nr:hypothetical protein BMS3Abin16_00209 [archaeon BMS3Abin16]